MLYFIVLDACTLYVYLSFDIIIMFLIMTLEEL